MYQNNVSYFSQFFFSFFTFHHQFNVSTLLANITENSPIITCDLWHTRTAVFANKNWIEPGIESIPNCQIMREIKSSNFFFLWSAHCKNLVCGSKQDFFVQSLYIRSLVVWMRVCLMPCYPCVIYYINTIYLISVHHNLPLSSASLVGFVHLWPTQWPKPSIPEWILALTPVSGPDSDPSRVRRWSLKP